MDKDIKQAIISKFGEVKQSIRVVDKQGEILPRKGLIAVMVANEYEYRARDHNKYIESKRLELKDRYIVDFTLGEKTTTLECISEENWRNNSIEIEYYHLYGDFDFSLGGTIFGKKLDFTVRTKPMRKKNNYRVACCSSLREDDITNEIRALTSRKYGWLDKEPNKPRQAKGWIHLHNAKYHIA